MIRKLLAVGVLATVGVACFAAFSRSDVKFATAPAEKAPPYVHVVVFYLNKDAPKEEADALVADAHELLQGIPTVRELRAGKPADMASPGLSKKDYAAALCVLFDDADGLNTYLKHPMHLKYVEKHMKHVDREKLLVFDFVNQKPTSKHPVKEKLSK
ncbi:MAG TPA: Dabb family protein [Gemmataceae bacterium]|nr:Dabb family protein [Gemmataceae bacterium]